jgi:molybdenum cofactor biosynthesis enzyme MoaA
MRTQTILVTRRCNQACGFCDRVQHDSTDAPAQALIGQIQEATAAGAKEIVFSGGEPLMRADLLSLVRVAKAQGADTVVVETNGTLIRSAAATKALKDAGVSGLRISIVTVNPERHQQLVGPATTAQQVLRGIALSLEAGLAVFIRLPIAQGLPTAASRLQGLKKAFPAIDYVVLAALGAGTTTLRPNEALTPAEVVEELTETYKVARQLKIDVELAPDFPVPPCIYDVKGDARRLFANHIRTVEGEKNDACDACGSCALAKRCRVTASQLEAAGGAQLVRPITDAKSYFHPGKNPGSRLRVLGKEDVEQFFHVDYEFDGEEENVTPTSRIGIIYKCNQVCTFCELADMDTRLTPNRIQAALDQGIARGSKRVILTGGEPTLSPDLIDHVAYAKKVGFEIVEVQTNAILLDRPGAVEKLREAGLTSAQVSLHGPNSEISDKLTAAPGTHQRTLRGVDNLLKSGARVILNHLIFKDNAHLLVDFIELCNQRWSAYKHLIFIQYHSARNEFADREEGLRHIARYSEYTELLQKAIDYGRSLGFDVRDQQDPTGIPSLCVMNANERYLGPIISQNVRPRFHKWESEWLTRVEACKTCDAAPHCMGVPRHYLELHGDSEFKPIKFAQPIPMPAGDDARLTG